LPGIRPLIQENVWHALKTEEVFEKLETSEKGLTSGEVEERLSKYGANELEEERKLAKLKMLADQLKSPLVGVLVNETLDSALFNGHTNVILLQISERKNRLTLEIQNT